ncbi:MAG: alkaline phosphatase family protein, partial [Flavobacteriaceae bacterium]|nr:alkaline phosphatase family protein [Flavobacteriaceae bacterium]
DDILKTNPDIWIWGGDNIYADTDDIEKMRQMYKELNEIPDYVKLKASVPIIGTWDDHDYGKNDAGIEYVSKAGSQDAFLDFMGVPAESPRRNQEGIYTYHDYRAGGKKIRVISLDTRYFRTALTSGSGGAPYQPNAAGEGELLGEAQWVWLGQALTNSGADFHVIMSSIQFWSSEHGWEKWANFPHEVKRFKALLSDTKPKGAILLSGDRHISEFSGGTIEGLPYELIDFTSSGLTHAFRGYTGEDNPNRIGEVVFTESFGLLVIYPFIGKVEFKMLGDNGQVLQEISRTY